MVPHNSTDALYVALLRKLAFVFLILLTDRTRTLGNLCLDLQATQRVFVVGSCLKADEAAEFLEEFNVEANPLIRIWPSRIGWKFNGRAAWKHRDFEMKIWFCKSTGNGFQHAVWTLGTVS